MFPGLNSKLELMVSEMRARSPRDADEWINSFVAVADRFPACIVITDMTIAGGPMVFVNRGKLTCSSKLCNTVKQNEIRQSTVEHPSMKLTKLTEIR